MQPNLQKNQKRIEILFSERGDFWLQDVAVNDGGTLRMALERLGYEKFIVSGVDPDNPNALSEGMQVRVHVV